MLVYLGLAGSNLPLSLHANLLQILQVRTPLGFLALGLVYPLMTSKHTLAGCKGNGLLWYGTCIVIDTVIPCATGSGFPSSRMPTITTAPGNLSNAKASPRP